MISGDLTGIDYNLIEEYVASFIYNSVDYVNAIVVMKTYICVECLL